MRIARSFHWTIVILALVGPAAQRSFAQGDLQTLHALIVADTLDPRIGTSVAVDADNVEALLLGGVPGERLKVTVLRGGNVKRQTILNYYNGVNASPNDALLFYYAGHGAIILHNSKKEHILSLNNDPMLRSELIGAMRGKRTGLIVVLTDCCSNYPKRGNEGGTPPIVKKQRSGEMVPAFRQLLFRSRGLVDITAADDGEFASGDAKGGIFTQAFKAALNTVRNESEITWTAFYPKLKKTTIEIARGYGVPPDGKPQSSRAFHLPNSSWGFVLDKQLVVTEIQPGSPADREGVVVGDKLIAVNGRPVHSRLECVQAMGQATGNSVRLTLRDRNNRVQDRTLQRVNY